MSHSLEDKQQQILAERRRRRRESHNAVERRRRDNINEKIQELASLVPEGLLYSVDAANSPPVGGAGGSSAIPSNLTKDGKPNKGTILTRSVDYIRHLQLVIDDQNRRELEMQDQVQALQQQLGMEVTEYKHTSAEIALAKFRGDNSGGAGGYSDMNDLNDLNDINEMNEIHDMGVIEDVGVLSPESGGTTGGRNGFTPDYDLYSPNS